MVETIFGLLFVLLSTYGGLFLRIKYKEKKNIMMNIKRAIEYSVYEVVSISPNLKIEVLVIADNIIETGDLYSAQHVEYVPQSLERRVRWDKLNQDELATATGLFAALQKNIESEIQTRRVPLGTEVKLRDVVRWISDAVK